MMRLRKSLDAELELLRIKVWRGIRQQKPFPKMKALAGHPMGDFPIYAREKWLHKRFLLR